MDSSAFLQTNYSSCMLCPRHCGVDRTQGHLGICGVPATLRLGRAALHWWEEPCLVGVRGSGAVFFSGCSLGCIYCQNKDLSAGDGVEISLDRFQELLLELQNEHHAANINLVTPGQYAPHIVCALQALRPQTLHIPVVYNSSGFEDKKTLAMLEGLIDGYLVDYKYCSEKESYELSRARNYPSVALKTIETMLDQVGCWQLDEEGMLKKGVLVRHLVLPGRVEESCKALDVLWRTFGNSVAYSIMGQYTPLLPNDKLCEHGLDVPLDPCEYEAVLDYADALGIEDYFWQEGGSCAESFIPAFDGTGVVRS